MKKKQMLLLSLLSFVLQKVDGNDASQCIHDTSPLPLSEFESEGRIICETERLILREFVSDDLDDLAEIMADPDVMFFSPTGPRSLNATELYLSKTIDKNRKNGFGKWAVVHKRNNILIGICGLQRAEIDGNIEIELGYRFAKSYWGKGFATEAARAVKDYAFKVLNITALISCIEKENSASIRVAQKNGLRFWKESSFLGQPCHVYRVHNSK